MREPPPAPTLTLERVGYADLPGWAEDDPREALAAFRRSCARFASLPDDRPVGTDAAPIAAGDWKTACAGLEAQAEGASADELRAAFAAHFTPYRASDRGDTEGLFTGYFEAELDGARNPGGRYGHPIYARPDDHVVANLGRFDPELQGRSIVGRVESGALVPYPDRGEIEAGLLADRGLELFWATDPVDVFLLQVQGSGRINLPDGTVARVGFAAHNGRPYKSIGRALIDRGELESHQASWQGIRGWIEANPDRAAELFAVNPRFIFFREIEGEGPIGAQGVALTPGRSLAIDPAFVPLGAPLWLDTTWPSDPDQPLRRLMVAQDTGGAIKGPIRGDFFWGFGAPALAEAGRMRSRGGYYLLLPNAVADRLAAPAS